MLGFDALGSLALAQITRAANSSPAVPRAVGVGVARSITANPTTLLIGVAGIGVARSVAITESKSVTGVSGTGVGRLITPTIAVAVPRGDSTGVGRTALPHLQTMLVGVAGIGVAATFDSSSTSPILDHVVGIGVAGTIASAADANSITRAYGTGAAGIITVTVSGGGTSQRPKGRTGFEPVIKRRPAPTKPEPEKVWTPPLPDRPRQIVPRRPAPELVEAKELPADLLGMQHQIYTAEDISDVERFLSDYEQDQQDADDIADILALLD